MCSCGGGHSAGECGGRGVLLCVLCGRAAAIHGWRVFGVSGWCQPAGSGFLGVRVGSA
jgi:hypothetical protein